MLPPVMEAERAAGAAEIAENQVAGAGGKGNVPADDVALSVVLRLPPESGLTSAAAIGGAAGQGAELDVGAAAVRDSDGGPPGWARLPVLMPPPSSCYR